MIDVNALNRRFSMRGVSIEPGQGGLPRVAVATRDAMAHIYLHGAHVTEYAVGGAPDLLFLSAKSHFEEGKPIRGGIPIIFPWFGARADDPASPAHGFARTMDWELVDVRPGTDGSIAVVLELGRTPETEKSWPHDFWLRYVVTVGTTLGLSLQVKNNDAAALKFEEALHTYLAVGDVGHVTVEGLAGADYLDKTDGGRRKLQPGGPIAIAGETDRVYLNTAGAVTVRDAAIPRTLVVNKDNSAATVLWNPWIAKAQAMADFGDDEWPRMLCVETANVADNAITLAPGQSHQMRAMISSVSRSAPAKPGSPQWQMAQGHA